MGLFDSLKGNKKEKELRFCYRCNKECSGFLNSAKLDDGKFVCMDCYPQQTKLMNQKGVLKKDFAQKRSSSRGVDALIKYFEKDKDRQAEFVSEETYFNGEILVDRKHMWFKLKQYNEVFHIQNIKMVSVASGEKDGKFRISIGLFLDNPYYDMLPVTTIFKSDAFFKKNQIKQAAEFIDSFHQQFCPNAILNFI